MILMTSSRRWSSIRTSDGSTMSRWWCCSGWECLRIPSGLNVGVVPPSKSDISRRKMGLHIVMKTKYSPFNSVNKSESCRMICTNKNKIPLKLIRETSEKKGPKLLRNIFICNFHLHGLSLVQRQNTICYWNLWLRRPETKITMLVWQRCFSRFQPGREVKTLVIFQDSRTAI